MFSQPWPWYVAGPLIGLVVPFVFWYGGKKWGMSSSIRHLCAATFPAGLEYFKYDWKRFGGWHLAMAAGVIVGGALAAFVLSTPGGTVAISAATRTDLRALGITDFSGLLPREIFSWEGLATPAGLIIVGIGSFLVGFGARYAGGCTSGHAISGLSTLKRSSLAAVLGFFAGGLVSAHFLLPLFL
jgi:uncharacterized membrane protein YedE/YeeE